MTTQEELRQRKDRESAARAKVKHLEKVAAGKEKPAPGDAVEALLVPPDSGWPGGWPNIPASEYGLRHGESGVTVVQVFDAAQLAAAQAELKNACEAFPEFNPGRQNFDDPFETWVLGGFSGLGNPSSFHNMCVRKLRLILMLAVLKSGAIPMDSTEDGVVRLEQLPCRLLIRPCGVTPTKEGPHKDEAKCAKKGDVVYGGWLNLNLHDQFFSCVPGSANAVQGINRGFAKIPADEEHLHKANSKLVRIPPGALLIFNERITHEVRAIKLQWKMVRLHFGWRTTVHSEPLTTTLAHILHEQDGFPLKSGQHKHQSPPPGTVVPEGMDYVPGPPPMWGPLHWTNSPHLLTPFASRFKDACVTTMHYTNPLSAQGLRWEPGGVRSVPQFMPSLYALSRIDPSIAMYPVYTDVEKAILVPNTSWEGLLLPSAIMPGDGSPAVSFAIAYPADAPPADVSPPVVAQVASPHLEDVDASANMQKRARRL